MKLINEKGKLFGVINLVDLACILLILLVVGGVGWKLLGSTVEKVLTETSAETPSETTTMLTTVRIRAVTPNTLNWLAENDLAGEQLIAGSSYIEDAHVVSVSYEPYTVQTTNDEGVIIDSVDPVRKDVLVVLESTVEKDAAILKISTQEVRVGRSFFVKTRFFEMSGTIDSVVVK